MSDEQMNDELDNERELITPGEILRDELEARGWTQDDLARILGRPLGAVNEIITGRRGITAQTAKELSEAMGMSADSWLNMETAYQLAKAATPSGEIKRRAAEFSRAPIKEMERRGWIRATKTTHELESELNRFFRTESSATESAIGVAAKQSVSEEALTVSQIAWCYRAINLAPAIQAAEYKPEKLRGALPALRELARAPESARRVARVLAEVGVRLVIIEHLQHTKIDGAALWEGDNPIIALSLRYGRMDSFWHTLHHEVFHILNEDRGTMLDPDLQESDEPAWSIKPHLEKKANDEAAASLIAPELLESFIVRMKPLYSKARLVQFANRIRIHPSIVLGQLQHRKEIDWRANRDLHVDVRSFVIGNAMTDGFGHRPEVV